MTNNIFGARLQGVAKRHRNNSIWRIIPVLLLLDALCIARPASAAEFHVATNGNDTNPGTQAKPFATLERARDEVRKLRMNSPSKRGITIWLHGGDYFRTNALELTAADSGTQEAPVI